MLRVLSTIFVMAGLMCCSVNAESIGSPLRLATNIWPGYEPLYLARELQFLDDQMVTLVEYQSASEVMRAFRNGLVEMAALTMDEVLTLLQYQTSVQIILVTDISNGSDAIVAKTPIKNLQQLTGKRVGVEGTALGAYMLARALDRYRIDIGSIQIVHLDVHEHEAAYHKGAIDAVVTFDPVRTRLISSGANELFTSREIPGEIVDVLVTRKQVLVDNKDRLKAIVDAWFKALVYFKENPDNAAQLMSKRLKISPSQILKSFQGLELPDREENRQLLSGDSPPLVSVAQRLQVIMLKNNLLNAPVKIDQLITPIFTK